MGNEMQARAAVVKGTFGLGVVAVVGAGLSMAARYPTTAGLTALLWDAIDADPAGRSQLADQLGVPDAAAKQIVGDYSVRRAVAWRIVERSDISRRRFQDQVANLDQTRSAQPSAAHESLAALIHTGIVECVISLNWDTALEQAYRRVYGTDLPAGILFKPHGDAADPRSSWTLPHQPGAVSIDVADRVKSLVADHPRTLLIVGYSESDQVVVDEIIAPRDEGWRVTRIGPSVSGEHDIAGAADVVLAELAADVVDREGGSAWHSVTFAGQRGIDAALTGQRLGPADVESCPRLAEVALVADALRRDHSVVLNGSSGGGKSITAYQALFDLCGNGYEVLRLRDDARDRGLAAWLRDLKGFPHRKVLLVDDAQDLSTDTVRELAETATADRLVLVVGVDHVAGGVTTYSVNDLAAVGTLAQEIRAHKAEVLPKIRLLDDRVGEHVGDEPFEERLTSAASEKTAWQFFYVLTGGWRRTARSALELREVDRADLLALALAVAQIASVDAGVRVEDLSPYADALGRDHVWVENSLKVLRHRRLVVENDGVLRCVHLRAARSLLHWMLHPPVWSYQPVRQVEIPPIASAAATASASSADGHDLQSDLGAVATSPSLRARGGPPALPDSVVDGDRRAAAACLRTAVDLPSTSLRGVAWVLGSSFGSESMWVLRRYGVRTPERDRELVGRALSTPAGPQAGMAAQLVEQLLGPDDADVSELVWAGEDRVLDWVRAVTPENGWAIASLVNNLANENRARLDGLLAGIDPAALARLIPDGGWPHIYSSTRAVDRITQAGGLALMRSVGQALDEKELRAMLKHPPDLAAVNQLLKGMAYVNPDLGLGLFDAVIPYLASQVSANPPVASQSLFETIAFLLGYAPRFLRQRQPTSAAKKVAKKFIRALDRHRFVAALARPRSDWTWHNFWDFVHFAQEADPAVFAKMIEDLDVDILTAEFASAMPSPGGSHMFMVLVLSEYRPQEAQALLQRFAADYTALDALIAHIHPELAVELLRRGLPLDLGLAHQHYGSAAAILAHIAEHDSDVAGELAWANHPGLLAGLVAKHQPPFEELSACVATCDRFAPGLIEDVLKHLPAGAVAGWAVALRETRSKREIAPLVLRLAKSSFPAGAQAKDLLRRFPSLRKIK